jgi:hypothetical protein
MTARSGCHASRMRIPVEVRPDFIEKVARRTDPLGAVEELVWNSLDADATDVSGRYLSWS